MSDLTEYLRSRHDVLFSTDMGGFFGNPLTVIKFLEVVCNNEINFGLEAVAFNHVINRLRPESLNGTSELIGGYHGRMGWSVSNTRTPFGHGKVAFLDRQITETQKLLYMASGFNRPIYVNIHNHELGSQAKVVAVGQATLVVENDLSPNSVKQAFELSTKLGIGRIYDLVHGGRAKPGFDWNKDWKVILAEMRKFQPSLVHIPIGTDLSDSLPNTIPNEFWIDLGKAVNDLEVFPVVECQWGITRGSVICNPFKDLWRIKYLQDKLKILVKYGIVK